jgi:hypothetical protein
MHMRLLAAALTCALTLSANPPSLTAQSADPDSSATVSQDDHQDAEILQLVANLDSDDYPTREAATEELIRLGSVVAPYVRQAAQSPNLEVNTRAQRILAIVSRQTFEEAIEAFLDDEGGQRGAALPGWERARARLGDSAESRRLFAEMYRAEPALLAAYGDDATTAVSSFSIRVDELYDQITQRNRIHYQFQNQPQNAIATNVTALLFVGADQQLQVSPTASTKFKMLLMQSLPAQRIAAAAEREHLRDWLGEWIVHRFNLPQRENEAITLGMAYDVPRTVELAQRVLQQRDGQQLQYAALCVGKYGQDWQLPLLERLLDDETVVAQRQKSVNGQMAMYHVQLRDVALLVLLHRTDQSPQDYGFDEIDRHTEYLFLPHSIAFEEVEMRDTALAKWHAWRRRHALFEGEPPAPYDGPAEDESSTQDVPATPTPPGHAADPPRAQRNGFEIEPLPE